MDTLEIHRTSIYRFSFDIEGDTFEFFPDDPSAFADAVGAIIDLTDTKRAVSGSRRGSRTQAAPEARISL